MKLVGRTAFALLPLALVVACDEEILGESSSSDPTDTVDGTKNGDESDVDCGGSTTPKCAEGRACRSHTNCESLTCKAGVCIAARPDDGLKNGDESDVDCGGTKTKAPRCAAGKGCGSDGDCASGACSYKGVCVARPSCKVRLGGDTCGPGEHEDPTNKNESCCTTLPLKMPDHEIELDKYTITAGRMRVFLESINGNVRAWVKKNRPTGWDPTWDDYVPTGFDVDPVEDAKGGLRGVHSSVWHQLGSTALTDRLAKDGKPYRYGCYLKGYGTHTYWMPDEVMTGTLQDQRHAYSKDVLDPKALNCVTSIMLRAFCHWDWPGSTLPTYLEYRYAYDAGDSKGHQYPWGNTPAPAGYRTLEQEVQWDANGNRVVFVPRNGEGRGTSFLHANWGQSYTWPENTAYPDMSPHIAAPGRFPTGNGPFGHADIGGNVFDMTRTMSGTDGQHPDNRMVSWGRNGSYGGHDLPFGGYDDPYTAPIMRKYGFAGGRCAMPKK